MGTRGSPRGNGAFEGMTELYHITERATWRAALAVGEYRMSTRGVRLETAGFIHCSLRHQLPAVAGYVYGDCDDELVLLVIDGARVTAPLRYEAPEPGGEDFPHLYGPLPVDAVTAVVPLARDGAGRIRFPAQP
jgi:uncharacterized protein (DUF952 family)